MYLGIKYFEVVRVEPDLKTAALLLEVYGVHITEKPV